MDLKIIQENKTVSMSKQVKGKPGNDHGYGENKALSNY